MSSHFEGISGINFRAVKRGGGGFSGGEFSGWGFSGGGGDFSGGGGLFQSKHMSISRKCRNCGSTEHFVRQCPYRYCQSSGEMEHDTWDKKCPKYWWLDGPMKSPPPLPQPSPPPPPTPVHYTCQQEFLVYNVDKNASPAVIRCKINELICNTLLDSGAGCSVINADLLHRTGNFRLVKTRNTLSGKTSSGKIFVGENFRRG